jgi:predicted DNA helicase
LLDQASVVCATLTGLDPQVLGQRHFDLLVIDEAAQAIEPSCWIGLVRAGRVVLAGDPWQLPPTILSMQAAREGLAVSLMERLAQAGLGDIRRQLLQQYRMHAQIMGFSSAEFYEGTLQADPLVERHLLRELPGVADVPLTAAPLLFVDTAGAGWDEEREPDGESLTNPAEARWVVKQVARLREAGVAADDLAVIAPYAAQVRLLREQAGMEEIEIDTVDGFQGREKEAILVSLVRSNPHGEIGFLEDTRRMNVALTRARRHLSVVGDSATLCHHAFYRRFVEYCERQAAYRTIWEEMEDFC